MGNQLVRSVKPVIRPINYYIADVPDLKFINSLGQTQFLKVALCCHPEGEVVCKVLSHEDPSLLLEEYKRELEAFALMTAGNCSVAAFRIVELRPSFAFIVRQYVRYSVYERLQTRPFLSQLEKSWIVYQIFKCMAWCHEKGLRHGDLKLENILVTSANWVVVTDFATYKPVSLPEDDPSFFNYFFDTSRRRCCAIAPERFVSANHTQLEQLCSGSYSMDTPSGGILPNDTQLTNEADSFSLGCLLAELYENVILFDLHELLYYRKGGKRDRLEQKLKKIEHETVRKLVSELTAIEPSRRPSCAQVLAEQTGKLFPLYFDKLFVLMRTLVRLSPDSKIIYLSRELSLYLPMILSEKGKGEGTLILLSLILSSMRSLTHVHVKLLAQRLLLKLVSASAPGALALFITDRLIPYLVNCLQEDRDHRVRGEAVRIAVAVLSQVGTRLPPSESNFFTDYLLEIFQNHLLTEQSPYVRLCFAQSIGRLGLIALHFLSQSCDHNYDDELSLLHGYFQTIVSNLLTDPDHQVRRALLLTPDNVLHLCTFFGRQKTNEVFLSHIITFLNDKIDFQLRLAFFESIGDISSFLGAQCSFLLYPLLQQGLCDSEEFIISKAIDAIGIIASLQANQQGLAQKSISQYRDMGKFLCHPNLWIRFSAVHFYSTLSENLSSIDLNCKMMPILSPYLSCRLYSPASRHLLLESLQPPLPRNVLDTVLDFREVSSLESLFRVLNARSNLKQNSGQTRSVAEADLNCASYRRLLAENIDDTVEEQLLKLSSILKRIHRNKRPTVKQLENSHVIAHRVAPKYLRSVNLVDPKLTANEASSANPEWQQMFGPFLKASKVDEPTDQTIFEGYEVSEIDYIDCPPYQKDVTQLISKKKGNFTSVLAKEKPDSHKKPTFRPKGCLVSSLHEHKSAVNQMVAYGASSFITCSDDGTLRIWDISGFANYAINRSKFLFKMEFKNGSPLNFKGLVCCGSYLVTYSSVGVLYVFQCSADSALSLVCSFKSGSGRNEKAQSVITSLTALNDNIFAVALTDSTIYVYDTRMLDTSNFFVPVLKLAIPPELRTITSLDGQEMALFAGTSLGHISTFDLRFNLQVNSFSDSTSRRIVRLVFASEGLYSSVYGNSEVTLWDYKLGQKSKTLKPHLSNESANNSAIHAILPLAQNTVIMGGTDMRMRFWDLNEDQHARSYLLPLASKASTKGVPLSSSSAFVDLLGVHLMAPASSENSLATRYVLERDSTDGSATIREKDCTNSSGSFGQQQQFQAPHYLALEQQLVVNQAHSDTISDLLQVNQNYLVSSDCTGIVKVWR